ncbi:MAG: hypothetical protein B0D86_03995 [Candidatus Sedimenticola endophacoides]|nr:MAG: hypothetical protein B0D86_03995 [Candidatus Sedimenticola endophacoides]
MDKEGVREFMMQLAGFAKTLGVTVILNYLSGDTFGANKEQLLGSLTTNALRLSSIVDGIILLRYVERDQGIAEIVAAGFDEALVRRIVRLVDRNEYKRRQAPPGVKITQRAFGRDRRYPLTSGF